MATRHRFNVRDLIDPLPSQAAFLDAMYRYLYLLFGGAAGPGKSYILRWALVELHIYWASLGICDVRTALMCEDYPTLKDRQISRIKREFPAFLGEVRETRDEGLGFYFRPDYGGGLIALRNLDDPSKYASSEFAAIAVDELTKNPRQTFDDLRFRLRWPGIDHTPFLAASNPGSIGHAWVKQLWIDRDFSGDNANIDPATVHFIPARAGENTHLPPSYMDMLRSLPDDMRAAMLDGSWDRYEGQVFREWRREIHVCEPFTIPPDWTRWRATDYGYSAPYCTLWFARSPDRARIVVYREHYASGVTAYEQARRAVAVSAGENIRLHAADPSMWQRREGVAGDHFADEYARAGIQLVRANNDRLAGLNAVREALAWQVSPQGQLVRPPRLQIFSTCTNLIRTLPALPYDPIRTEDVDTDAEDHAYDALRYGLMVERQRREESATIGGRVPLVWR